MKPFLITMERGSFRKIFVIYIYIYSASKIIIVPLEKYLCVSKSEIEKKHFLEFIFYFRFAQNVLSSRRKFGFRARPVGPATRPTGISFPKIKFNMDPTWGSRLIVLIILILIKNPLLNLLLPSQLLICSTSGSARNSSSRILMMN